MQCAGSRRGSPNRSSWAGWTCSARAMTIRWQGEAGLEDAARGDRKLPRQRPHHRDGRARGEGNGQRPSAASTRRARTGPTARRCWSWPADPDQSSSAPIRIAPPGPGGFRRTWRSWFPGARRSRRMARPQRRLRHPRRRGRHGDHLRQCRRASGEYRRSDAPGSEQ